MNRHQRLIGTYYRNKLEGELRWRAQWRPPARSVAYGQAFNTWRPNRLACPHDDPQGEDQGSEKRDQLEPPGTLFEGRYVSLGIVAMPVPAGISIVNMRPVKCSALAIRTRMQMQSAHLQDQQTEAHNDDEQ